MSLSSSQLKFFADYIQKELGIVYSSQNFFQLEKRMIEIAKSLSLPSEDVLYQNAQKGIAGLMKQLILDTATNNETLFFRDPKAFQAIENHIIPGIRSTNPDLKVIRIWCAASSFGQEPYSLAMMIKEMSLKDSRMPRVEIVATDISEKALTRAKSGMYSQLEVQRGLPAPLLVKYFTKSDDDYWTIKSDVRISVQFKKQNLVEPFSSLGDFDFILCRNVLIYQSDEMKKTIVDQMAQRLTKGGYFLMGAAESLFGVSDRFEQLCKDGAVFFKKAK